MKFQAGAHRPRARFGKKSGAISRMFIAKALRDQNLNFPAEELFALIPEQFLSLGIHEDDISLAVDNDDRIRRGLQQTAEFLLRPFSVGDIANCAHHECALLGFERA